MDARSALVPLPHPYRPRPGPPPAVGPGRAAAPEVVEEIDAADLVVEAPLGRRPTPPSLPRAAVRTARPGVPPVVAAPRSDVPLAKLPLAKVPNPKVPTGRAPIVELPLAHESIVDNAILEDANESIVDAPLVEESTAAPPVVAPVPVASIPVASIPVASIPVASSPVAPVRVAPIRVAAIPVVAAATVAAAPRTETPHPAPMPWGVARGAAASSSRWGREDAPRSTPWWRYTAVSAGLSALVTTAVLIIGLDRAAASDSPTAPPAPVVIAYDPGLIATPTADAPAPSTDADEAPRLLARRVALRGTRNLAAGLTGPARSAFEEALRLDPRNRAALAGLGRLDVEAKRFASAIERLTLAVRLEPRDRELHGLLAQAHTELGHGRAAARHLKLAQGE